MPILMKCACGKQMRAADEHAGKKVKCPGCGALMTVPEPGAAASETPAPAANGQAATVTFKCDQCGKAMQAKAKYAGKLAQCPGCQAKVRIPKPQAEEEEIEEVEVSVAKKPAAKKAAADEEDVEEVAISASKPGKKARAAVADADADDLEDEDDRPKKRKGRDEDDEDEDDRPKKRKARVAEEEDEDDRPRKKKRAEDDEDEDEDRPRKKKKKKKAAAGGMLMWLLIGGGAAAFLMLGGGALLLAWWMGWIGGRNTDDLDFLVDDTTSFDSTNYAELWKNDNYRSSMRDSQQGDFFEKQFGLKPEDIERLTNAQIFNSSDPFNSHHWTIVLSVKAYDDKKIKEKVVGSDAEEKTANGKKYYMKKLTEDQQRAIQQREQQLEQIRKQNPNFTMPPLQFPQPCVYFHNKGNIYVVAQSEATMKKVLEGYPRKKTDGIISTGIKKAGRSKYQSVHASVNKDGDVEGSIWCGSVSGSTASLEIVQVYKSEDKAREAKKKADEDYQKNRSKAESEGLKSWSVSQSGKEVTVSMSGEIKDKKKSGGGGGFPF